MSRNKAITEKRVERREGPHGPKFGRNTVPLTEILASEDHPGRSKIKGNSGRKRDEHEGS